MYAFDFASGICTSVFLADIPCFCLAVMGIEGIATEIENPFGLDTNDLSVPPPPRLDLILSWVMLTGLFLIGRSISN